MRQQKRPLVPNPLAVAFGGALRSARGKRATKTIAKEIGIADSFYRLIESGRNHASISKATAIWRAFEGELTLDAILLFLASIAASEDRKDRKDRGLDAHADENRGRILHSNISLMCSAWNDSHPFKSFLKRFLIPPRNVSSGSVPAGLSVLELVDIEGVDVREIVGVTGLTKEALGVLSRFTEYDPESRLIREDYSRNFFRDLPSNYKPMFDGLRASVKRLPRMYAPETSWEWEDLNQDEFSSLQAICSADSLISENNLMRYRFEYLWNRHFDSAVFHILDGGDGEVLKREFWANLKKVLEAEDGTRSMAGQVEQISAKTVFRPCEPRIRSELLGLFGTIDSGETGKPSNAIWFFQTVDQALVGAASFIDQSTSKSEWIRFLTFAECSTILTRVETLLRSAEQ